MINLRFWFDTQSITFKNILSSLLITNYLVGYCEGTVCHYCAALGLHITSVSGLFSCLWRVCYQLGLPCLVLDSILFFFFSFLASFDLLLSFLAATILCIREARVRLQRCLFKELTPRRVQNEEDDITIWSQKC